MKSAENQKQPLSVTHLQHEFGVTNEMGQEKQYFLISRTKGEALEVVRGTEREPGLEQWRRLAALYDPLAAGRSLDHSRQNLVSTESRPSGRPLGTTKPGKIRNIVNALETSRPRTCDWLFFSPRAQTLKKS